MSETRFTPGPWSVYSDEGGAESSEIRAQGSLVANVYGANDFPCITDEDTDGVAEEFLANAQLIAAAPELYAALEALPLDAFDKDMDTIDAAEFVDHAGDFYEAMCMARAALRKARGESEVKHGCD